MQRFGQRLLPDAPGTVAGAAVIGGGSVIEQGRCRGEQVSRAVEAAAPGLDRASSGHHLGAGPGMPGEQVGREVPEHAFGCCHRVFREREITGLARQRQPELGQRQPGRHLVRGRREPLQPLLRRGQQAGRGVCPVLANRHPGRNQQRRRLRRRRVRRHPPEHARQWRSCPGLDQPRGRKLVDDGPGGELPVTGRGGVADGIGEAAVPPEPPCRPPVQLADVAPGLPAQLQSQHVGEQRVVAIPAMPERLDERVRPRLRREHARCLPVTGQLPGQVSADPVEDAGLHQQVAGADRLAVEHLVHQVAEDRAVFGAELLHELFRVGMAAHRQGRQPEPRGPALVPLGERRQRGRRQADAVQPEQQSRFGGGEGEIAGPDLGQVPGQPEPVQRQQRVHPGRDHQPQPRAGVPQQVGKLTEGPLAGQKVNVVEHQHRRRGLACQRRCQPEQELMPGGISLHAGLPGRGNRDAAPPEGLGQVEPERPRLIVIPVNRHPGRRAGVAPRRLPGRGQYRLACPGRAGDDGERPPDTGGEQLLHPRPGDRPVGQRRRPDLGEEKIPAGLGAVIPRAFAPGMAVPWAFPFRVFDQAGGLFPHERPPLPAPQGHSSPPSR